MLNLLVSYAHLLSSCLALGCIVMTDWYLYRGRYFPIRPGARARLITIQHVASLSLVSLWITGAGLIWLGYQADLNYLLNPKLWAKISVVVVLTINGIYLHTVIFPKLGNVTAFMRLSKPERLSFVVFGAASGVSWLYAAFLGIARPWNFTMPYWYMMGIFALVLFIAVATGVVLMIRDQQSNRAAKRRAPSAVALSGSE